MGLVFPAEHGVLTTGGLPVAESDTQLAHTRPEPSSIYAGLPRWLADGMSVGIASHKPTSSPEFRADSVQNPIQSFRDSRQDAIFNQVFEKLL